SLKRFDLRSAFGTWLYKIAVNECWDYFRKKKVRPLVYESSLSDEQIRHMEGLPEDREGTFSHSGVDAARRAEQRDLLDRLLVELDEQDRAMLAMFSRTDARFGCPEYQASLEDVLREGEACIEPNSALDRHLQSCEDCRQALHDSLIASRLMRHARYPENEFSAAFVTCVMASI